MSVEKLLQSLGIRIAAKRGDEQNFFCPFHKGGQEKTPSASVNVKTGEGLCWVCGPLPLVEIISRLKNIGIADARILLKSHTILSGGCLIRWDERYKKPVTENPSDAILAPLENIPLPTTWTKRWGTKFLKRHGVLYEPNEDRVVFVIRGPTGEFRGVVGRAEGNQKPKYLYAHGTKKSDCLLGEHLLDAVPSCIHVVEGPRDWLAMRKAGVRNTVATLGCMVSVEQADRIRSLGERVVCVYDNDEAGQSGMARLKDLLGGPLWTVQYPDNVKDPCDMSSWSIRQMVAGARLFHFSRLPRKG